MGNKHSHHSNSDPSTSNSNIKQPQHTLDLSNATATTQNNHQHLYHEVIHNEEADAYLPKHLLDALKQQAKNGSLIARTGNNNSNTPNSSVNTPNTVNTPRSNSGASAGGGVGLGATPLTSGHRREPSYISTGGNDGLPPIEITLTNTANNQKTLSSTTPRGSRGKNTPRKTLGFSSSSNSSSKEDLRLPTSTAPTSRSGSGGNAMQAAMNRTKFRMERDLQSKSCFTLDEFKLFKGIFLSFCNVCFQGQHHSHQTMATPRGNTQEQWKNGQKRDSVSSTMSNSSSMASIMGATPGKTILRQALLASSVSYYDVHQLYLSQGECNSLLFQHGKVVSGNKTKTKLPCSHYQPTLPPSTNNVQPSLTQQQTNSAFLHSSLDKKTSPPLLSTSPNNASYASPPQTTFIPATVPPLSLGTNSAFLTLSNIEDMDLELVEKFVFDAVYRAVTDGHLANENNHYHHHHHISQSTDSFVLTFQRFILSLAAASISIRDGQVYAQKMSRLSMSTVFSDDDSDIEEHEQLKRDALLRERSSLVFSMLDLDGDDCLSREDLLTFLIAMDRLNLLTLKRTKGMLASARKMLFSPRSANSTTTDLDTYSDGGMSPVNSEKTKGKKSVEDEDNTDILSSSLLTSAVAQSSEYVENIKLEGMTTTERFKIFETLVDQFFDFSYNQRKNSSLLNLKSASSLTLTRGEFFDNSQIFDDVFLNGLGIFETFFIPIMKPVHEFLSKSKDAYEITGKLKNMFSQQTYFCEIKGSMMFLYDADPSTITGENSDIHSKCIETIDLRTCVKVINEKQPELLTPPTTPQNTLHNNERTKKRSIMNSRHSGDGDEMFQDSLNNPQSPASPSTSMPTSGSTTTQQEGSSSSPTLTNGKPTFSFSTTPYFSFLTLQSASQPNASSPSNTAFVSVSSNFVAKKFMFMADENEQKVAWLFTLFMQITQATELNNRFHSFAPERDNVKIKWYVDGKDAFRDIAIAMDRAKEEIFISDWLLSPLMYLIRGDAPRVAESRLDILLKNKAAQGVKIYIILWKETSVAGLNLDTRQTKKYLRGLFPRNIYVCSHPKRYPLNFTHHQKIVVVDQSVAFLGGLDLAYGRWDDHHHSLTDDNHTALKYPGCDYLNPNLVPLTKFEDKLAHFKDVFDREFIPREPWHDVHSMVSGLLARDVALNFIERWNHHTKATPSTALQLRTVKKNPLFDYYKLQNASLARKEKIKKKRFAGMPSNLYNNISNIQNTPRRLKQFFSQYNTPPSVQIEDQNGMDRAPVTTNIANTSSPMMIRDENTIIHQDVPQGSSSNAPHISDNRNDKNITGSPRTESRIDGVRARTKSWFEKHNPNQLIRRGTERERNRDRDLDKEKEKEEKIMKEILKEKKKEEKKSSKEDSKPVEEISCPEDEGFVCNAQVVRSISRWSGGNDTEQSIYLSYLQLIEEAQHFIYIENQFFIGGTAGSPVKNAIPLFIGKKIVEKMRRGEIFRVYIVVPSHPEGDIAIASVNQLMKFQYKSINRSSTSLFNYIKQEYPQATDELIEQYVVFFCLRNYGFMNNNDLMKYYQAATSGVGDDSDSDDDKVFDDKWRKPTYDVSSDEYTSDEDKKKKKKKRKKTESSFVDKIPTGKRAVTEHVYVHSKLMIVDDRHTIIGSANINDRSMLGNRDSEIAVVISDKSFTTSKMNGRPYRAGKFAHSLRLRLWKEHLGLFPKKKEQKLLEKHNQEISSMESEEDLRASMDTTPDQINHLIPPPTTTAGRLMGTNMAKIFHFDRSQNFSRPKSKLELELEEHERKRTQIEDPIHNETHNIIMTLAKKNTEIYDTVFTDIISDRYKTIEEYVTARSKTAIFDTVLDKTPTSNEIVKDEKVMVVSKSQILADDVSSPLSAGSQKKPQFDEDEEHHMILSPSRAVLKLSKKIHDVCMSAINTNDVVSQVNSNDTPTNESLHVNETAAFALAKTEVEKRKLLKKVNGYLCLFPLKFAEEDQFKKTMTLTVAVDDVVFM